MANTQTPGTQTPGNPSPKIQGIATATDKAASDEAISDEVSCEVAAEILTKQIERRDPQELLKIVLAVHTTLRELSEKASERRYRRIMLQR